MPPALAYAVGSALHRRVFLRPRFPVPALPLIVIGSLRAGGAGKTAVTLELARRLTAGGKRVGVLAYWIHKNRIHKTGTRETGGDLAEVFPDSDWRRYSDEAVLLARASGARVFVTRNRARAWNLLARDGAFDVLLSDDGLMDARLRGARTARIALVAPGESPGLRDLLPAGPYRLTAAALRDADLVLTGPLSANTGTDTGPEPEHGFRREIVLPDNFDRERKYWALSGLGNPEAFRQSLAGAGLNVAGLSAGPDHGLPDPGRAGREALRAGASGFLHAAKDGIKLRGRPLAAGLPGIEVGERITFTPAFLSALEAFLAAPSS